MHYSHDYEIETPRGPDYSAGLREAIDLFERGEYWETHEVLERLWLGQHGADKHFLAGFIQLACAILKTRQGNATAGRRLFARALAHLAWVEDRFQGIDVRLLETRCHEALEDTGLKPIVPHSEHP
jgi:predicted metal-dependent hydrolase